MKYLDVTYAEWRRLRKIVIARDPTCAYCGAQSTQADHVIPSLEGGQSKLDNLVGCCARCNASKGARRAPKPRRSDRAILMRRQSTPGAVSQEILPGPERSSGGWKLSPKGEKKDGNP